MQADLPVRAIPIRDESERRSILVGILAKISADLGDNGRNLEDWVARSPLVEVVLEEAAA